MAIGISQVDKICWTKQIHDNIPNMTALVFALYTLQNANQLFKNYELQEEDNQQEFLFTPHPAQVITIFRLLGLGYNKEQNFIQRIIGFNGSNYCLRNTLIQVGTGEGKSVVLAITSTILAIYGFEIYCACYSGYLCQRDKKQFLDLYLSLNIEQKIKYGTFNQLCEQILNQKQDIRQHVSSLIEGKSNQNQVKNQQKIGKILLIDEVDVFLNKEFYGNIYSPSAKFAGCLVKNLTDYLWNNKKKVNYRDAYKSEEFENLIKAYPEWKILFTEILKQLIFCLLNFDSHIYQVNEKINRIGYQVLDSISYNQVQSYYTLFAYYQEFENKKISLQSLEENIMLNIICGEFSYAEIPKDFQFILGVSGTLDTMNQFEKDIIENEYDIKKKTIMPSVYPKNNLKFNKILDVLIKNQDDYHIIILREIEKKLNTDSSKSVPVLVFFESKKKLMEFYNLSIYQKLHQSTQYLTEDAEPDEKDRIIKSATNIGQITLLTRSFGRGTDFIVRDDQIKINGGIHVIQTFLSEELSEEKQIQGRTARQGEEGTYQLILFDKDLEIFNITLKDIEEHIENIYPLLDSKRKSYFLDKQNGNKEYIQSALSKHQESVQFLEQCLNKNDIEKIKAYLVLVNKGPSMYVDVPQSRILCLVDATGSMSSLLNKVKTTIEVMFQRAKAVLKENHYQEDCFLLQFACYRNYPQKEPKILIASPWESSPQKLREFISCVSPFGGSRPGEAVEIGFQYANFQQLELEKQNFTIDQILLLGDAPSNTYQESIMHRKVCYGEAYWGTTKFKVPGDIKAEVLKLSEKKVTIKTFYLNDYAKNSFIEIANWGKGSHAYLDINRADAAQQLTEAVTIEILQKVGDKSGQVGFSEKLISSYKAKFSHL